MLNVDNLIIFCAKYLVFLIPLVWLYVFFKIEIKSRRQFILTTLLAVAIAVILSKLAGKFYFHHRPFVMNNITPLVSHPNNNGFPSDHTLLATTLALVITVYRKQLGVVALIVAISVGIGRVLADVHWPVDIIGGLMFGVIAAYTGYYIVKKLFPSS